MRSFCFLDRATRPRTMVGDEYSVRDDHQGENELIRKAWSGYDDG